MKKIKDVELAEFAKVSTRTLSRWKKNDLKKYDRVLKQYKDGELSSLRKFLKENKIELMGEFGIYFTDIDDFSVGILAEDTNFLIRNNDRDTESLSLKIRENLKLLKEWL